VESLRRVRCIVRIELTLNRTCCAFIAFKLLDIAIWRVLGTCLVERIRIILNGSIGLQRDSSTNTNGDDFYDPGMTSRSTVLLMMALEEAFGVERLVV
jgi:hypothetical protein